MVAGKIGLAPRHRKAMAQWAPRVWLQKLGEAKSLSQGSGDFIKNAPACPAGTVPSK